MPVKELFIASFNKNIDGCFRIYPMQFFQDWGCQDYVTDGGSLYYKYFFQE